MFWDGTFAHRLFASVMSVRGRACESAWGNTNGVKPFRVKDLVGMYLAR